LNVALPAVLLFLLLAPGFIYHHFSQAREVRQADMTPFGTTALKSVSFGLLIDSAVLAVAVYVLDYRLYLGDALRMLSGAAAINAIPVARYEWLNDHPLPIFAYFFSTFGIAVAGALVRRYLVTHYGLDRPTSRFQNYFRQQAPWHYLFSGIDVVGNPAAVVVSAIVPLHDAPYLFTGLLMDYELKENGELDRIILSSAMRRKLAADRNPGEDEGQRPLERFYPIDGDRLILRSNEWTTLNVKFLDIDEEEADGALAGNAEAQG
jgi:hypothetical protein